MSGEKKRRRSDDSAGSSSVSIPKRAKAKNEESLDASFSSLDSATSVASTDQNVRVVVRLRPLSTKEKNEQSKESIKALEESCSIFVDNNRRFEYDAVFGPLCSQSQLYNGTAGDMVKTNIFRGFNVTILAYGQTGSGKTYTMGTDGGNGKTDYDQNETISPPTDSDGVIPRAVYDLFRARQDMEQGEERVKVKMSYLEIYNEEARDLLSADTAEPTTLYIRDSKDGVFVQNLSFLDVKSPRDVSELMEQASTRRVVGSTAMNDVSSRSHAICTLHVTISSAENGSSDIKIQSKLTLVDLAGSERIKRTGAEGQRMKEGININKGLFVLGQVVSALSELGQNQQGSSAGTANTHIPYRDSKLTRLLQDSLGGNSRTVMVACVSPADSNVEESTNTLRYAQRTRSIKNSAVRNVVATTMSPSEATALRRENQVLKLELLQARAKISAMQTSDLGVQSAGSEVSLVWNCSSLHISLLLIQAHISIFCHFLWWDANVAQSFSSINGLDVEKLEVVTKLRAHSLSLQCKIEQKEEQLQSATENSLTASLRADKWQVKYSNAVAVAKKKGVDIPLEDVEDKGNLVGQLRKEAVDLKSQLQKALEDAAVARTTAAAIVAGGGDLTSAEEMALANDEVGGIETAWVSDDEQKDQLAAELVSVSGTIEQKEAMALQMNKERECMDMLQSHFEGAVQRLQEEVNVLASEKESLLIKVQSTSVPSKKVSHDNITKMRVRIKELESKISGLKKKTEEHKKSLRLREIAEKKCSQLASEIQEDKKRRVALQRKLKEESHERRSEKRAAQLHAARMIRDSQKLKYELNKVKDAAAKQAATLRRRAAEALSKQKRAVEQQRKQKMAASMRANAGGSNNGRTRGNGKNQRKDELKAWFDHELDSALAQLKIRDQIKEHTAMLSESLSRKKEVLPTQNAVISKSTSLQNLENQIEMRRGIIKQLEKNSQELQKGKAIGPSASSMSLTFEDISTWNGLSRSEVKFAFACAFERFLALKIEMDKLNSMHSEATGKAIQKALTEQKRLSDESISKIKIQHSEQMMTLLQSTKDTMEHEVRLNMLKAADGGAVENSVKSVMDEMLGSYLKGCTLVGEQMKEELQDIRKEHDGITKMVGRVADGILANNAVSAVPTTKKKKSPSKSPDEDDFYLEDDDDALFEDSDDSDWNPETPAKKRKTDKSGAKNRTTKTAHLPNSSTPDSVERYVPYTEYRALLSCKGSAIADIMFSYCYVLRERNKDDGHSEKRSAQILEDLKVADLRELLRQRGLVVSGKKADLLARLRNDMGTSEESSGSGQSKENQVERPSSQADQQDTTEADKKITRKPLAPKNSLGSAKIRFDPSIVEKKTVKVVAGPDTLQQMPPVTKLTASAKKRRRRGMANALSKAMLEAEKITGNI